MLGWKAVVIEEYLMNCSDDADEQAAYDFLNGVFADGYTEMDLEQYLNNN